MPRKLRSLLIILGTFAFSACSSDVSNGAGQHASTESDLFKSPTSIRHCFRNEYSNGGTVDVVELTIVIDEDVATGTYNWIPAFKDTRLGQFSGSLQSGTVTADYEYEQEGQVGSTSISISIAGNQATVSGGPVELGLNQSVARVEC